MWGAERTAAVRPPRRATGAAAIAALALLAVACGGGSDGDGGNAEAASSQRDATASTTTTAAPATTTTAAPATTSTTAVCAEEGTTGRSPDEPAPSDGAGVEIGEGGISVDSGDGASLDIGRGGVSANGPAGRIAVGQGGVAVDQCLGDIEVDASDGQITVSGPEGEVSLSTDEAVGALGGEVTERGIEVALPDSVLFDFGSAALRPESSQQLSLIAGLADAFPDAPLTIGGHADAIGSDADNQRLSEDRAAVVAQALATLGVEIDRMTATGFGETEPVAPNTNPDGSDNAEGRQLNRRVEVLVVGAQN
jgi:outer membrane protein OmpA-like peptidoglycan-associated protein